METSFLLIAAAVCAVAGTAGWFLGAARSRSAAAAAEARVEELRRQVDSARQGFDGLREKLETSESGRIKAETHAAEVETHASAQIALLEESKTKLADAFKSLAAEALAQNNRGFLTLAEEKMRGLKTEADQNIDKNRAEISVSVADMKARLEECQTSIRSFEGERRQLYGRLEQSMSQILSTEQQLRVETSALRNALTSSAGTRGSFGEMILEQLLQDNGFVNGVHYETQVRMGDDGESRPDFVVNVPGNRKLIIDSKEVAGEFVLAHETEDPSKRREHLDKLAQNIRSNYVRLCKRDYLSQMKDQALPFVVMFISNESALRDVLQHDPTIFREACDKKIYLASPLSVIPLIHLVGYAWQQHQLAANAKELGDTVEELGNRLATFVKHLSAMRDGVDKTAESWEKALASWDRRVAPQIEKARTLGGRLKETEPLLPLETRMRLPSQPAPAPNEPIPPAKI